MNKTVKTHSNKQSGVSRRDFIVGATSMAAFTIVPRFVLGGPGYVAPSGKIHIAGIGVGGQGNTDLLRLALQEDKKTPVSDVKVVALCDVDRNRAEAAFALFPDAHPYWDFRQMLEQEKDIDGVVIATPDHVHAAAAMAAFKKGKHVYCEKPLTHTIHEARMLTQAARQAGVATQMGNHGQASEGTRRTCEMIWAGAIGPVREVHAWTDRAYWPQGIDRPSDTPSIPETLKWDLWLGPSPERPYHPAYLPFNWRGWWDFGTGALGDMGCHVLDSVFRSLKLGPPIAVSATRTYKGGQETYPVAAIIQFDFPARGEMPPVKLVWYDGGLQPPRPDELEEGRELSGSGKLFIGEKGKMLDSSLIPESRRKDFIPPPKTLPRSIGHYREWIEACKGGTPAGSNFDVAGPMTEAILLGNVALRSELTDLLKKTKLQWDSQNMKFTNCPEADPFVAMAYRAGWEL